MSKANRAAHHAWIEALQKPGCALCRLAEHSSQRYIATLFDEAVMDVAHRDTWRAARGLCPWHATVALQTPQSANSVALLYADVLRHDLMQLAALTAPVSSRWRWRAHRPLRQRLQAWLRTWSQQPPCPVCVLWQTQECLYVQTLLNAWPDAAMVHAFTASAGLCWAHTRRLVERGQQHPHLQAVLAVQQAHLQRLRGELAEFIRKQDYRFAREAYGPEADAWRRVVALYGAPSGEQRED